MKRSIKIFLYTVVVIVTIAISWLYLIYRSTEPYPFNLKPEIAPKDIMQFTPQSQSYHNIQAKIHDPHNKYFLSVVVPIHNVEGYLAECLDSILAQSFTDYEVIMVENNSTDQSPYIAEQYALKYSNFKLIKQDGGGLSGARNTGIKFAKGKFISFIDSDDFYNAGVFQDFAEIYASNPASVYIYDYDEIEHATKNKIGYQGSKLKYNTTYNASHYGPFYISDKMIFTTWRMIYSRQMLIEKKLAFRHSLYHEDTLFAFQMLLNDIDFYIRNKPLLSY